MPDRVALAVDVGGTNVRTAVIGSGGELVDGISRAAVPFASPGVADVDALIAVIVQLLAVHIDRFGDLPVGLGICGNVDRITGVATLVPNLGMRDLPVVALLRERLGGLPVVAATDTQLAALGESRWGAGRDHPNFAWVTIGTGYGVALVLGGRLYDGDHGYAGNIGHARFDPGADVVCGCGQVGCVETVVAGPAIARMARDAVAAGRAPELDRLAGDGPVTAAMVTSAAEAGDGAANDIVGIVVEGAAASLAATVNLLDLSLLVFGGGVVNAAPWLIDRIDAALRPRLMTEQARRALRLVPESFPDATLRGAAALALDQSPSSASR